MTQLINPQGIWVPRAKILEAETKFSCGGVAGEYTIKKYKADTMQLVQEVGPFSNLITDIGLDRVGTSSWGTNMFVGTGTAPPDVAQTQMANYLAQTATPQGSAWTGNIVRGGAPEYWVQGAGTKRFAAGVATGNLTEVGIGWFTSGTTPVNHRVFSRALIVDSLGNPITITVLPDEVLDVTYSLRYYPYVGEDVVQIVNISGVPYTFTTRSLSITSTPSTGQGAAGLSFASTFYTGTAPATPPALADITSSNMLNQGLQEVVSPVASPYVQGTYTLSATLSLALNAGNLAYGLRGLRTSTYSGGTSFIQAAFQSTITPAIPKDATKIFQMGASYSWGRHTP